MRTQDTGAQGFAVGATRRACRQGNCRFRATLPVLCLLVVAMFLVAGCAHRRPIVLGGGYQVRDVRLEGVSAFSKKTFLGHLFSNETSWVPFTPNYPFDEALVGVDTRRIEDLYRSYGYYQASVRAIDAKVDHRKKKADLVVRVVEGRQAKVRTFRIRWAEGDDADAELRAAIEAEASLAVDGPFETIRLNQTLGDLRMALFQRGHPLARVSGGAEVSEAARLVDVTVDIDPGPFARIGRIDFDGLVGVPRYMLDREVRFAKGQPWSPALVKQVEDAIKGTQVFRWVATRPADKVEDGLVDLDVEVSEADPQRVRLGLQLSVESVRWQEQFSADYTHTNLFGNLTRLDLHAVGGWAEIPNPWDPYLHGPVFDFEPALSKKGLFEDYLVWTVAPGFEVNLQEGYQYWTAKGRLGVGRWFAGRLHLSLNYNLRYVRFFNISPTLDRNLSILGRDFRNPFLLSYADLRAELYLTNAIVNPTDGMILEATYDLAGGVFLGNFNYHKLLLGMRGYWKAARWLQVAGRFQTGMFFPYKPAAGAPISEKFYLGGANTVRGWGSRRISPRVRDCQAGQACTSVPVGGFTMIEANLDLRFRLSGPWYLVAFLDLGDVQDGSRTWKPAEWNYTAGPGLRYDSPLGLVRLDVGFHLNQAGVYPDEPFWGIHFGLGEAY